MLYNYFRIPHSTWFVKVFFVGRLQIFIAFYSAPWYNRNKFNRKGCERLKAALP